MALLNILHFPDPRLRTKAVEVSDTKIKKTAPSDVKTEGKGTQKSARHRRGFQIDFFGASTPVKAAHENFS